MFFSKAETTTASGQSRQGATQPATLASGIMWMSQRRNHPRAMVALRRGPALHNLSSLKLRFLQAMRSLCGDGKHTFIIIEEHSVHQTWQKRMQGFAGKSQNTHSLTHAVSFLKCWAFQLAPSQDGQEAMILPGLFTFQHPFGSVSAMRVWYESVLSANTIAKIRCVKS